MNYFAEVCSLGCSPITQYQYQTLTKYKSGTYYYSYNLYSYLDTPILVMLEEFSATNYDQLKLNQYKVCAEVSLKKDYATASEVDRLRKMFFNSDNSGWDSLHNACIEWGEENRTYTNLNINNNTWVASELKWIIDSLIKYFDVRPLKNPFNSYCLFDKRDDHNVFTHSEPYTLKEVGRAYALNKMRRLRTPMTSHIFAPV